jgi:TatD DNase family protein
LFIDTHAHLYWEQFDEDRDAVIQRANDAGVSGIINIATDVDTSRQSIALAERHRGLYATAGIHPNDAGKFDAHTIVALRDMLRHPRVVAIGEIGLDFYREWCAPDIQEKTFREQIRLAKEEGLPIVIHNRQAGRQILEVLLSEKTDSLGGVFHCFSEDLGIAREILALGFHISFTGNVTFKRSHLPEIAAHVPLERLLLETDCPFLAPEPKRGRRNEPAYVVHLAEKLAQIKALPVDQLAAVTTRNACTLWLR